LIVAVLFFELLSNVPRLESQGVDRPAGIGTQVVLSRTDLAALPHVKVSVTDHATKGQVTYEGVSLSSVLEREGVSLGESLKGKRLASCLLVEAADDYRVVIALPELDPACTDQQILLAFLRDGKPPAWGDYRLGESVGPNANIVADEETFGVAVVPVSD
jgi:hypothetical protein